MAAGRVSLALSTLSIGLAASSGCAREARPAALPPSLCPRPETMGEERTIRISVQFDMHGQVAEVPGCPGSAFSIDFSRINLLDKRFDGLMREMARSAYIDGRPVRMTIRGSFRRSSGLRDTEIVVEKVLEYGGVPVER